MSCMECIQHRMMVIRELKKQKTIREIMKMWKEKGYSQEEIDMMITAWMGTVDV